MEAQHIKTDHELKTWEKYYKAVIDGHKRFELRKNDRDFKVGDLVNLREFMPDVGEFSGDQITVRITYVLKDSIGFGLSAEYCIFGFEPLGLIVTAKLSAEEIRDSRCITCDSQWDPKLRYDQCPNNYCPIYDTKD